MCKNHNIYVNYFYTHATAIFNIILSYTFLYLTLRIGFMFIGVTEVIYTLEAGSLFFNKIFLFKFF